MDHFALPHDTLFQAQATGKLHRNFMGYTATDSKLLIGLGASAISDAFYAYSQNFKKVEDYSQAIGTGGLAIFKGHIQTEEDISVRICILDIACRGRVLLERVAPLGDPALSDVLHEMCREGILELHDDSFLVTDSGRAFIRNICSAFDRTFQSTPHEASKQLFSRSI